MKTIITGGGGFLGNQLARVLLKKGHLTGISGDLEPLDEIVIFDHQISSNAKLGIENKIKFLEGDISSENDVNQLFDRDDISVFHLASVVSGEGEQNFDLAMEVNLNGGLNIFESCRKLETIPRLVFASSVAIFGGDAMPQIVTDTTKPSPQTTYGVTKFMCELMINDYSRKGFFDGRTARLPTIFIRPGKPNAAASSFASSVFREPLNGQTCILPVSRDQKHPMLGYRNTIECFIQLHELSTEKLGDDRAFNLPNKTYTVAEMINALEKVSVEKKIELGSIMDKPDHVIQKIVDTWPTTLDSRRALELGLPMDESLEQVICNYIDDFL